LSSFALAEMLNQLSKMHGYLIYKTIKRAVLWRRVEFLQATKAKLNFFKFKLVVDALFIHIKVLSFVALFLWSALKNTKI